MVRCGPLWSVVVPGDLLRSVAVRCGPLLSTVICCGPLWSVVINRHARGGINFSRGNKDLGHPCFVWSARAPSTTTRVSGERHTNKLTDRQTDERCHCAKPPILRRGLNNHFIIAEVLVKQL